MRRQPAKANRAEPRTVEVWGDWSDLGATTLVGEVTASVIRGSEVTPFEYGGRWLTGPRVKIDPHLPLFEGRQYPKPPLTQFGAFADASPDRWGRTLLDRREALRAREDGRPRRTLMPLDYLLGVHDGHRMGALRFKLKGGPFPDDDDEKASPPWTSLGELAFASQQLERIGVEDEPQYGRWLAMLLAPGRSLGGARPKASVRDGDDVLWIAKFPSASDDRDVGAWEMVAHELAHMAGITVPEAALHQFASHHHTFLSRRFDRNGTHRLHFSSAMTQLGQTDSHIDPGVGYLDIAAFLAREGAAPESDLPELWRRVVFGVCICNTDDHLRNHGFLWTRDGWRLAPAFDLNPNPSGTALAIPYDGVNVELDLEPVREAASVFRLADARADQILATVVAATKQWREVAAKLGIRREEREGMARAFQVADHA